MTVTQKTAAAILQQALVADAHFDLPFEVAHRRERGQTRVVESTYLPEFKAGGVDLLVCAIFVENYFLPEQGLRRALVQISGLLAEAAESPGLFSLCRTVTEIRAAKARGEIALLLSLEGADPLHHDLRLLPIFYQLGVRGLGLVWSRRNAVGDGCTFKPVREGRKGGLTSFGVELVAEAERLGMYLDVSHLNDEGFWDLMEVASKPVMASHSNCRSLAPTMRNLTDQQIEAIGKGGGLVCCNSVNLFLRQEGEVATVEDMVRHLDHMVSLAGIDAVGIGLDLCDSFADWLSMEPALTTSDVLTSHRQLCELVEAMLTAGYSEAQLRQILGGNLLAYLAKVLAS